MLSRCLMVCTLILAPSLAGVAQSPANVRHFGRNILVAADETVQNASCFLCSAEVNGHAAGSVRVFAGHVFLNGSVGGNVLVFGGNLTLTSSAAIGGHVFIFGGHLHQDSTTANYPHTVLPPIIFLPLILVIFAIIGGLIVLTRRMVRGPVAYPPLPRL
ncbi:MAG: hypothetical protein WCD57_19380 [Acidobacteriaceae bacterium]